VLKLHTEDNMLKGIISSEGGTDRRIMLNISRNDPEAIRLVLFFLLLDMKMRQGFLGSQHSSLNLNANLNLP